MQSFLSIQLLVTGALGQSLITVSNLKSGAVCCQNAQLKTCNLATVDPDLLGSETITLPGGASADFSNNVRDNPNAYHYEGDEADVILTFNPSTGGMHGHAMMSSGESYTLEYCGDEGHVWKEIDVANLGENEGVDFKGDVNEVTIRAAHDRYVKQAEADNVTMVTYSVKFYYTSQFAAVTPDIEGFLDQVIAETNQGYANSLVPLQVVKQCSEMATINEDTSASTVLTNFKNMKGTVSELRGSADAAAILVDSFNSCGIGYLNVISSGNTVTATKKTCAVGYYSFGHEVGHNIGLHHDPDTATNTAYPYGHGHLIEQGTASTGYRTILAYSATGHSTRVNYYSNPSVTYPPTGTSTGVEGLSNNAALLILNRMSMSAIGDESVVCVTVNPTAAPTAAPTTAAPGVCTAKGTACIFPFKFNNRLYNNCTTADGNTKPWCATAVNTNGVMTSADYCDSNCIGSVNYYVHPDNSPGNCRCGVPNSQYSTKIVGGWQTETAEYPWQVALLFGSTALQSQGCGGTLVGDKYVVTAAHCTDGQTASDIKVLIGDTNMAVEDDTVTFIKSVFEIRQNIDYDSTDISNDISVLVLDSPVDLTAYPNIKPACLPYVSTNTDFVGNQAIVSGWGTVGSGLYLTADLQEVNVDVYGKTNCGEHTSYMTGDMFCAGNMDGGKDSCQGDSGGPLVAKDTNNNGAATLIGVVSWGFGCADAGAPGVYSDVPYFMKNVTSMQNGWLVSQLTSLNTCPPPDASTWILPAGPATSGPTNPTTAAPTTPSTAAPTSCTSPNSLPTLAPVATTKKVRTENDCKDLCLARAECDYWAWKNNRRLTRRVCKLYNLKYKAKNNWFSGPRDCAMNLA